MKGVESLSLSAAITGTGIAYSIPNSSKDSNVNLRGAGTISGGTIIIEEASDPTFAGTWSQIQSITASALTGGAEQIVHIAGLVRALRARISSDITGGGTVTVGIVSS
jgi:hypothetical protein